MPAAKTQRKRNNKNRTIYLSLIVVLAELSQDSSAAKRRGLGMTLCASGQNDLRRFGLCVIPRADCARGILACLVPKRDSMKTELMP
jgi:hypothetical protein